MLVSLPAQIVAAAPKQGIGAAMSIWAICDLNVISLATIENDADPQREFPWRRG